MKRAVASLFGGRELPHPAATRATTSNPMTSGARPLTARTRPATPSRQAFDGSVRSLWPRCWRTREAHAEAVTALRCDRQCHRRHRRLKSSRCQRARTTAPKTQASARVSGRWCRDRRCVRLGVVAIGRLDVRWCGSCSGRVAASWRASPPIPLAVRRLLGPSVRSCSP